MPKNKEPEKPKVFNPELLIGATDESHATIECSADAQHYIGRT